jgi:hypothetical protein
MTKPDKPARADYAEPEFGPRMGGIALKNGLILLTERFWAAAIREADGRISVASGKKTRLPGGAAAEYTSDSPGQRQHAIGSRGRADDRVTFRRKRQLGGAGVPLLRGLGRFGETLMVLGLVKSRLPNAALPLESGRVSMAFAASLAATSLVKVVAPRSALAQETGAALAAFLPAVLALKNSSVSAYHGAEHKVIGGRETALRATARSDADEVVIGDSAAAAKEHDRCGSNLVGPYMLATVITNLIARKGLGRSTPASSAVAGAASLGIALEAMRWASEHSNSILARGLLLPGRAIQKRLTTSEPTNAQLEVGERALAELMRLENAAA